MYAESLGPELGMFVDPLQQFGALDEEMLRALRLVVDTGLHEKHWTRDQAIEYMLAKSHTRGGLDVGRATAGGAGIEDRPLDRVAAASVTHAGRC